MGGISVLFLFGILSAVFYLFITLFLIVVSYILLTYIFEGIALMRISENLGCKGYMTSWIPFYNKYLLGRISGSKILGIILLMDNILIIAMGFYFYKYQVYNVELFILFLLLLLISFILNMVISHKIFKMVTFKYGDILTIVSVLSLGILRPIFLFIFRNKKIVNKHRI